MKRFINIYRFKENIFKKNGFDFLNETKVKNHIKIRETNMKIQFVLLNFLENQLMLVCTTLQKEIST